MARHWLSKKTTVEECLTLDINKLVRVGLPHRSFGELRWNLIRGGEEIVSVVYQLGHKEGEPAYILKLLSLTHRDQKIPGTQDISLVDTELHSGGKRFWFMCPNCKRRVGRLHLPAGKSWFFCRECYDLTYTSCQESHTFDSLFTQIGVPPWIGSKWLRMRFR